MTLAEHATEPRLQQARKVIVVDIVTPAPLPDELARGLKGRLMRWNGLDDEKRANRILAEASPIGCDAIAGSRPVELLASVLGQPRETFICQHTMLPIRRAIASGASLPSHGSDQDGSWRVACMLLPDRPGAYFCIECIFEDLYFHGTTYWRRDHQLAGRYCCEKHEAVLHFTPAADAFLRSPYDFLKSASQVRANWAKQAHANPAVRRFLFIQSEVLARTAPLALAGVSSLLREACARHGLQHGDGKHARGRYLSDALADTYGAEWASTVVGDLSLRSEGRPLHRIDARVRRLPAAVYLASFGMLYDDAQAALSDLFAAGGAGGSAARSDVPSPNRSDEDELRRLYIRYGGCHRRVASAIEQFPATLARRLDRMGLPSLNGLSLEQVDQQLQAFIDDGASLSQACSNDPEATRALERLLAKTARNLFSAVRQIVAGGSRGSSRRRPEPPLA